MRRINEIILSWDTLISIVTTFLAICYVPESISAQVCGSIYSTAISVLSIIFSIFFASLAVIMAFPDNEFITFIERPHNLFTRLIKYFKTTLYILFFALLYTIVAYVYVSINNTSSPAVRPLFVIFIFCFTYSLFATMIAVHVTLKLTGSRASYLANKHDLDDGDYGETGVGDP